MSCAGWTRENRALGPGPARVLPAIFRQSRLRWAASLAGSFANGATFDFAAGIHHNAGDLATLPNMRFAGAPAGLGAIGDLGATHRWPASV